MQINKQIQVEQTKLHRVVGSFLSAFDLRVLPWFDSDGLLRGRGVFLYNNTIFTIIIMHIMH